MSMGIALEPIEKRLGYALKRAHYAFRDRMEEGLRDLGISAAQYAVMCTIELKPGSSNAELARLTFVTPQTMQGIIGNLERDGLLRRKAARDHGRILRSELTARGKRLLKEAHTVARSLEAALLDKVGTEDANQLCVLLKLCADSLTDDGLAGRRDIA